MPISFGIKKTIILELENVCVGGSCFASSNYSGSGGCAAAFDGITEETTSNSTIWLSTGTDTQGLGYSLPTGYAVTRLIIHPSNHDANYLRCPTTFQLRASNSEPTSYGTDGDLIYSVTGINWTQNVSKTWNFSNALIRSVYWIYMTDKEDSFGKGAEYCVGELGMYA